MTAPSESSPLRALAETSPDVRFSAESIRAKILQYGCYIAVVAPGVEYCIGEPEDGDRLCVWPAMGDETTPAIVWFWYEDEDDTADAYRDLVAWLNSPDAITAVEVPRG